MMISSNAPRPFAARLFRLLVVVLTFMALPACAVMPNAPSDADIERGLNTPFTPEPSLGGLVTDAQSGRPIVGAVITVQGRTSTTGVSGTFGFDPNLTGGVFPVAVSHQDYVEVVREVEIKPYAWVAFKVERR